MGVRAYDEIVDFIASGTSPSGVIGFRPSEATRRRVNELLAAEREGRLSEAAAAELAHYLEVEHLMRLAKVRARARLGAD